MSADSIIVKTPDYIENIPHSWPVLYVNVMAAGALAPYIARLSSTMVLTLQDRRVLYFNKEKFYHRVKNWLKVKIYV